MTTTTADEQGDAMPDTSPERTLRANRIVALLDSESPCTSYEVSRKLDKDRTYIKAHILKEVTPRTDTLSVIADAYDYDLVLRSRVTDETIRVLPERCKTNDLS